MANNTPPSEKEIFRKTNSKEPNMKWMHKLIIPRVSYCWRKLADYLDYPVEKKREIEERQRGDPYKCCAELMEDWLTSDRGVTPKTWHTLVSVIKEVAELKSSAKSIEQLLLKEGLLSYPLETETATNQKHDVTDHQLDQQQATGSMDHSHNAAGSSIQDGIEYIKSIVRGQFTEQEMIEALQHTKINPMNALDYLLKKGTESVDTPEMPSKVSDEKKKEIPKENLKYTIDDLKKEVKDVLPKFDNNILYEHRDQKIIEGVLLLLMVVNSNEFLATMNYFSKSEAKILNSGGNNYYVGKWGQIPAALVQGIVGPDGAQQLTCSSINLFKNLKVIIAVGVCGTMGRLGDVIVSSRIDGCNLLKIQDNQIINRSLVCRPGKNIYNFLMFKYKIWSYPCTKQGNEVYEAKAVFKPMLSGTPLITDGEFRDKLLDNVSPEAGGMEMEGIGVVEGIDICNKRDKIEFIIVKAGCDYADEEKSKEWQPVAAMAAADFVYKQLDKEIVHDWFFKGLVSRENKLNPRVLQIMLDAKEKNLSVKARHSKVLFCGASAVGKTNFINLLLDNDFVEDHKSTEFTESHQCLAKLVTVKSASCDEQCTFEKLDYETQIKWLKWLLDNEKYDEKTNDKKENKAADKSSISLLSDVEEKKPSPTENKAEPFEIKSQQITPSQSELQGRYPVEEEIASAVDIPPGEPPDVWNMLTFIDTGGQPEFINMLPAINNSAMITFIVHSMEGGVNGLDNKVAVITDGTEEKKLDYDYCHLIKMLFSMRKLKITKKFEKLLDEKGEKKCYLSLVGTKSDLVAEGKIGEEVGSIWKKLKPIITDTSVLISVGGDYFVPVNNRNAGKDSVADRFRNCIYKKLKNRDTYHIPIVWMILELEIKKRTKKEQFIYFNEIVKICKEHDLISDEADIRAALQYFHHTGVFLYYSSENSKMKNIADIVITDYRLFFENVTEIVKGAKSNKPVFEQLRLNGRLEQPAVDSIEEKLGNTMAKYFLQLLEQFAIISPIQKTNQYFMPCVLPTLCTADEQKILDQFGVKGEASPLLMQIAYEETDDLCDSNHYLFPSGVFCFLINQLLMNNNDFEVQWSQSEDDRLVYNNFVVFYDITSKVFIILMNKLSHMEIKVQFEDNETIDESLYPKIKYTIKSTLKVVCKKLKLDISHIRIGFPYSTDEYWTKEKYAELKNNVTVYRKGKHKTLDVPEKIWFSVHGGEEEFKMMLDDVCDAFDDDTVNIDNLLMDLNYFATKDQKIPLFKENFFENVTSIKELFAVLGDYWNPYDHDVLAFLVETAKCEEARKIFDEFSSSASNLVYHCFDQTIPNKALQIKVATSMSGKTNITIDKKTIEDIKESIVEFCRLEKCAMVFKCATVIKGCQDTKQCIAIGYSVPDSVMIHIQKYMPTTCTNFKKKLDHKGIVSIHCRDQKMQHKCLYGLITEDELDDMIKEKEKGIESITKAKAKGMMDKTDIVLITANSIEKKAVLSFLKPRESEKLKQCDYEFSIGFLKRIACCSFGKFGKHNAALLTMGRQGPAAAQSTIITIAMCFKNLKAIFAVGVACGVEGKADKLDVIVADRVKFYTEARLSTRQPDTQSKSDHSNHEELYIESKSDHLKDEELHIESRSDQLKTSINFFNCFQQSPSWPAEDSFIVKRLAKQPKKLLKPILSGNFLIDNKKLQDDLLKAFAPDAVGIEMESAGFFYEFGNHNVQLMVVKAVCDFGDGKKNKEYQPTAALLAAECVDHYLSEKRKADKIKNEDLKFTASELEKITSEIVKKFSKPEFTLFMNDSKNKRSSVQLLLMTVSGNEFHATLHYMAKKHESDSEDSNIPKTVADKNGTLFYIGNFAKIPAALVQHKQGKSKEVASEALKIFVNLKVIVAVGVCGTFGELGDLIVSSKIVDSKGQDYESSNQELLNYILAPGGWEFNCTKDTIDTQYLSKIVGKPFLSLSTCDKSEDEIRERVCEEAMGIEREGWEIVNAKKGFDDVHFIIAKAGCNYANEEVNKAWEPVAAMAAANFVYSKFSLPRPQRWFKDKEKTSRRPDDSPMEISDSLTEPKS